MSLRQFVKRIAIRVGLHEDRPRNGPQLHATVECKDSNLGLYTYASPYTMIQSADIGKFCSIGPATIIGYGEHPIDYISSSPMFYHMGNIFGKTFAEKESFERYKRVTIGNDVWIGANAYIKNGVIVGDGAVIAAGSVVVKDVPPYSIVGGVPAKVIRFRFDEEIIDALLRLKWWDWSDEKLQTYQPYFITGDATTIREFITKAGTTLTNK
jgi:acetyltransferase-like isoleucine patch superfamily enzyme